MTEFHIIPYSDLCASEILALPATALVIACAGFLAGSVFWFFVPETLKKYHPNSVND